MARAAVLPPFSLAPDVLFGQTGFIQPISSSKRRTSILSYAPGLKFLQPIELALSILNVVEVPHSSETPVHVCI